jgi:hypothetical protein
MEVAISKKFLFATIGSFLMLPKAQLVSQGANVIVFFNEGRQVTGELLAVRDTALLIDTLVGKAKDSTATQIAGIVGVSRDAVQKVRVKGESFKGKGRLYGTLVGAGLGVAIGFADGNDPPGSFMRLTAGEKALTAGAFGGLLGGFVGAIYGAAWSTEDKEYNTSVKEDWASLKAVARYPEQEPEFLRSIF